MADTNQDYVQRLEGYATRLEAEAVTLWKTHQVVVLSVLAFAAGFAFGGIVF